MKRIICFILVCVSALCLAIPAFADDDSYEDVTNNGRTGAVNIAIVEYQADAAGSKQPYVDNKAVLPGQKVSKIVCIQNKEASAYIRVKASYDSDNDQTWLNNDLLAVTGQQEEYSAAMAGWIYRNGYWYYTQPVKKGQEIEFMSGFTIPSTLGNEVSGINFSMNFVAEAVQEVNFTPDFTAEEPWLGTLIEDSTYTPGYDPGTTGSDNFSVAFEGGAQGLVKVGDDFFSNWARLMPGDVVSDEVQIVDNYGPVAIYFRTENVASDALLSALEIEIRHNDTVLYKGTMAGTIDEPILLGDYERGDSSKLTYTVTVPSWLSNSYSMSETKTKWIFSAKSPIELPATGGRGIEAVTVAGSMFVAVAVLLWTLMYVSEKKGGRRREN